MKYMLLIAEDESIYDGEAGQTLLMEVVGKHMALIEDLQAAGVEWSGHGLKASSTATTVRTEGGAQTLHDGPFAETREKLGGFYVIDVADLDAAIGWARRIPLAGRGAIEVRPVEQY